VVTGRGNGVPLDPDGSGPNGARALTHVLRDHGVQVQVERSSARFAQAIAAEPGAVVVVTRTDLLSDADVQVLHDDVPTTGRTLVLVDPSQDQLDVLTPGVLVQDAPDRRRVAPGCGDTTAQRAGAADAGGQVYDVDSGRLSASAVTGSFGCYLVHGDPSYLVLHGQGRTVLVGQPLAFTNQDLAKDGNAALAVGTFAESGVVVWLVPSGGTATGQESSLSSLLPRWVGWVVLQLFVVVGICMLWRGRRLGRLVTEPLPVVVRAVETTEGRARMYRRTRARARVAWTLRDATIQRLREQSGLPRSASPSDVIAVFSGRVGIPSTDLTAMLLGPPPSDDAGLVRLAQILDQLDREVQHR
jgi:Domain of unknown function (DUF4350)